MMNVASMMDYTLLTANAAKEQIEQFCDKGTILLKE